MGLRGEVSFSAGLVGARSYGVMLSDPAGRMALVESD